ncbi:hypothetical protein D3C80_1140500 [compost metagenome]
MGRGGFDLHIQHCGEAAQPLGTNPQPVDLVIELDPQLLFCGLRTPGDQLLNVDVLHQGFLGEHGRLLGGTADADPQHARRAPAGAHGRHGFEHPFDHVVGGVEHHHLGLVLGAAALGRDAHFHLVPRDHVDVHHGRGVVLGVLATAGRIRQHAGTQRVVRVGVGTAGALIHHLLDRHVAVPLHLHADLDEAGDDAGVLAQGAMPFGGHAGVDQDLGQGILGGRVDLAVIGSLGGLDKIEGVVERDVLQGVSNGIDKVLFSNDAHIILTGPCRRLREQGLPYEPGLRQAANAHRAGDYGVFL